MCCVVLSLLCVDAVDMEHDLFDDRILCWLSYPVLGGDHFGVLGRTDRTSPV